MKKVFAVMFAVVVIAFTALINEVQYVSCHVQDIEFCNYLVAENDDEIIIVTHGGRDHAVRTLDGGHSYHAQSYFKEVAQEYGAADKTVRYFCCFTEKQEKGDIKPVISHNDIGFVIPTSSGVFFFSTRVAAVTKVAEKKVLTTLASVCGVDSGVSRSAAKLMATKW